MSKQAKILFLFLDGVGLGKDDPETNPFARASMPNLEKLLDQHKLLADGSHLNSSAILVDTERATLLAIDACMGIEGFPQSASGQAALLTGKNVPAWLGEHEGPKPTEAIVDLIRAGTIFSQLGQKGKTAALLNAFPPRYFETIARGYRLPGVIALSALSAGIKLKTKDDLLEGSAISADFSGEGWRSHLGYPETPVLSCAQVGQRLNTLAESVNLAIFEYWLTDVTGHHQDFASAQQILQQLDAVICSLVSDGDGDDLLILITSDHGNMEDMSTRHHTRNDVPLLLIGSKMLRAAFLQQLDRQHSCRSKLDLTAIAPAIEGFIG